MKKVMVYGTLGPACADERVLMRMISEGMDGVRLNLSHTTLGESAELIEAYRSAARSCGVRPELLIDMQGPELRIGDLDSPIMLREGGSTAAEGIPFPNGITRALGELPKGTEILLDDGKLMLVTVSENELLVKRGGVLYGRKSVSIRGLALDTPALTEADRLNLFGAGACGVTAVMQPFVRGAEDLREVRRELRRAGLNGVRLLAKIENREGVAALDGIIPCCDEVVIARGDLGNSMELWELPAVQKRIAAACLAAGRDFMVVTQMLDSMMHRQTPTRAEVSDIFNAVLDGASSVMVTGETASGEYPALAIRYLANTVREAETYIR